MPAKPPLPDDREPPAEVNGWTHDPDDTTNGHCWRRDDDGRPLAVRLFGGVGTGYATVTDDRVAGVGGREKIAEYRFESDDDHRDRRKEAVGMAFDDAIAWMEDHGSEWSHPRINEAGFQPPAGYELTRYSIGSRETIILYHQVDAPDVDRLCGIRFPELTVDSCPYLEVRTWIGSGNSDVRVAPWQHAHGSEKKVIAETPDECGLEIALTTAREFARKHVAGDEQFPGELSGQSSLSRFAIQQ